jgi:PHP family Zn ribbon phosphoesterase
MLCDFHIHSHFSDGRLSIPQLVDLYGKRGFGAIAITDHLCEENTFLGHTARFFERTLTRETFPKYLEILREEAERAWKQYRMLVIPGYELTKNSLLHNRSAHVVVLGAEKYLSADQEIPELLKQVRDLGALSIAAHPVSTGHLEPQTYYLWSRRRELANQFDAWEVASGKVIFEEVRKSGLPMIANSDLHHPRQLSSWKTKLSCERHRDAIFAAIRRQELDFVYFEDRVSMLSMNTSRLGARLHV